MSMCLLLGIPSPLHPSPDGRGDGGEGNFYHSNFSIFFTTQYVSRVKMPMGPQ